MKKQQHLASFSGWKQSQGGLSCISLSPRTLTKGPCFPWTQETAVAKGKRRSMCFGSNFVSRGGRFPRLGWKVWGEDNMCRLTTVILVQLCHEINISTYAKQKRSKKTLNLLGSNVDFPRYAAILQDCGNSKNLPKGKHIHGELIRLGLEQNTYIGNLLISMYAKCGDIDEAVATFQKMFKRDVVSWNAMISAYAQHGNSKAAFQVFEQMQLNRMEPSKVTFLNILGVCTSPTSLESGKRIHKQIICHKLELDVAVGTALVNMYSKCGSIEEASQVFKTMPARNVISWTSMIAAYAQHGLGKKALLLFEQMQQDGVTPNKVTFVAILDAFSNPAALADAKGIHACIMSHGLESDLIVGNALANMYAKCGSLEDARRVFDGVSEKDIISWTTLIAAYAQQGQCKEALALLEQMQKNGINPNKITFLSVLDACSSTSALVEGKLIHSQIIASGFETDVVVGTALIRMYGKCGNPGHARMVFDNVNERDLVCWNSMIAAYAQYGHGEEARCLLGQMQQEGLKPDNVTLVSILSACGHAGLVDYGVHFFSSITLNHGFIPTAEHYACVIDLLGREGRLSEAEDFINRLPVQSDATVWLTLLSACRIHGDLERAQRAAEHVLELEPQNSAPYVVLSNVYATVGLWNDKSEVRELMMNRSVKKEPGHSLIEAWGNETYVKT
ncbi:hypothetical protein O6H91_Y350600 [Diphasiastrum complanatum]|nr:hypothetical protein O6H91_Y350600 [Diphasiastrum complanatum]